MTLSTRSATVTPRRASSAVPSIDPGVELPDSVLGEAAAAALADTLKALADPLRLRLIAAIAASPSGERCVCDLTAIAAVSQPTISHHLKKLKDAGLLLSERRGTWVHYRLAPERRSAVNSLLEMFA